MSLSKLFTNYAVKLHALTAQSGGAVYIDGVQSVGFNPGLQTLLEGGDGAVYNTFGALRSGRPTIAFSTNDLKAVLDELTAFQKIDSDGTHPGLQVYWQQHDQGGTRKSGSNHVELTIANGLLVLRSISLPHQGTAIAQLEAIARQESSTAPVTFDEAAALPSASAQVAAAWTLGKVDINGTQIPGVNGAEIDFGVQPLVEGRDSDVYPTFAGVRRIQPSVTLRTAHVDLTSLTTEDGVYVASGVVLYAKKRSEGGTFVADGTAQHISFTLGKCRVETTGVSGDPKEMAVRLTPWNTEGGSAPITVNTATAIS